MQVRLALRQAHPAGECASEGIRWLEVAERPGLRHRAPAVLHGIAVAVVLNGLDPLLLPPLHLRRDPVALGLLGSHLLQVHLVVFDLVLLDLSEPRVRVRPLLLDGVDPALLLPEPAGLDQVRFGPVLLPLPSALACVRPLDVCECCFTLRGTELKILSCLRLGLL